MLSALQAYFKKPTTVIGIVTAMMFQVIFSLVWMTGYDGVTDNAKNLKIAVVNEDKGMGPKVVDNLKSALPFVLEMSATPEEAKARLDRREVQMVLHVPADFTPLLQAAGQKAQVHYSINESNPALIKSMMQSVAAGVTASINKEATIAGAEAVLTQASLPPSQAHGIAQGLAEKVAADYEFTNPVSGMNNQMIPMMLVLASFVGAMIMGMNLQQSTMMIGGGMSKWHKYGARVLINIVSSVVIALIGSALVLLLGGKTVAGFAAMWLFQSLFLLTFMFFSQMFLIVFGMAGMLLNIASLSIQLVSSGAMVPRELLGSFYHSISQYLPATYAVEGSMNLLFGGPSAASAAWALAAIAVVCAALGALATGLRKEAAAKAPVPAGKPALS
ncbi:YhgE/Pip domain-containing protein [Paenibacillus silviterrae]|uniref:YhgE/Pip domain-containing protein n=1 Tax=Paenibacillus silviterrae TaxID=3242194 RepID=UPI0025429C4C|nr:ABC transporter permease [Paenibacillus chinjuensis]